MEVGDQLPTPAALPSGKKSTASMQKETGRVSELIWREKSPPHPGMEHQSSSP
jgi:hypothetical protein